MTGTFLSGGSSPRYFHKPTYIIQMHSYKIYVHHPVAAAWQLRCLAACLIRPSTPCNLPRESPLTTNILSNNKMEYLYFLHQSNHIIDSGDRCQITFTNVTGYSWIHELSAFHQISIFISHMSRAFQPRLLPAMPTCEVYGT